MQSRVRFRIRLLSLHKSPQLKTFSVVFKWRKNLEVSAQSMSPISENPSCHRPEGWDPMAYLYCAISPSLSELIGPERDTQSRLNQSNLLFPETEIRILRCWPDSAELWSQTVTQSLVSGRSTEGWFAEREKQNEADLWTKAKTKDHVAPERWRN